MADKIQKVQSDLLVVNAGVREVNERLNEILAGQSFAETSVAITGGQQITSISLAGTGLKGKIPSGAFFLLSYPDGSLPKAIENQGADLVAGTTSITISQVVTADVPYPVGSLISSANYATNDSQFAAGNTTEVQYNGSGQLAADSNFTFETATETLEVTNATISGTITGDLTGDVTGNVTGDVAGDLTGNVTSTSVLDDGVTATTQADATSNLTVATTEFVMNNAGQDPGGTGTQSFKEIQFNNNGDFDGNSNLAFNPSTSTLSTVNISASDISGTLASNIQVETSPANGDDSTKVATTEWVLDNSVSTPGGSDTQVQYNNSGAFDGSSDFTFNSTTATLSIDNIKSDRIFGENMGDGKLHVAKLGVKYWYLTPQDFMMSNDGTRNNFSTSSGLSLKTWVFMSGHGQAMATFTIPMGLKVTAVFIKGNANLAFSIAVSGWSSPSGAGVGSGTVNTELTGLNLTQSSDGTYHTIKVTSTASTDLIYGARLTLENI